MITYCPTNFYNLSYCSEYSPTGYLSHGGPSTNTTIEDSNLTARLRATETMTNPSIDGWSSFDATPFGGIGNLCSAFTTTQLSSPGALTEQNESTSSHDDPELGQSTQGHPPNFESISFPSRELQSSSLDTECQRAGEDFALHNLGRSRLIRTSPRPLSTPRRATCLPHKQVERKYREGLNKEFERLRRAVPTLPQGVYANVMGATKPSKSMVLAAAIEYIKRVERERDAALGEVRKIRMWQLTVGTRET